MNRSLLVRNPISPSFEIQQQPSMASGKLKASLTDPSSSSPAGRDRDRDMMSPRGSKDSDSKRSHGTSSSSRGKSSSQLPSSSDRDRDSKSKSRSKTSDHNRRTVSEDDIVADYTSPRRSRQKSEAIINSHRSSQQQQQRNQRCFDMSPKTIVSCTDSQISQITEPTQSSRSTMSDDSRSPFSSSSPDPRRGRRRDSMPSVPSIDGDKPLTELDELFLSAKIKEKKEENSKSRHTSFDPETKDSSMVDHKHLFSMNNRAKSTRNVSDEKRTSTSSSKKKSSSERSRKILSTDDEENNSKTKLSGSSKDGFADFFQADSSAIATVHASLDMVQSAREKMDMIRQRAALHRKKSLRRCSSAKAPPRPGGRATAPAKSYSASAGKASARQHAAASPPRSHHHHHDDDSGSESDSMSPSEDDFEDDDDDDDDNSVSSPAHDGDNDLFEEDMFEDEPSPFDMKDDPFSTAPPMKPVRSSSNKGKDFSEFFGSNPFSNVPQQSHEEDDTVFGLFSGSGK